jgi:hypothetical protein
LKKLGRLAVPALKKALAGKPPLDVARRLEDLIAGAAGLAATPEELRAGRAVEVLERIRTPEARDVLKGLAGGAEGALTTQAARAALGRLGK